MRFTNLLFRNASKAIDYYGRYHPSVLSIQQFVDFGRKNNSVKSSFLFLRKEIPVRLANIMKEIQLLPEPLIDTEAVKTVRGWYEKSFEDILEFEHADPDHDKIQEKFLVTLDTIRNRHLSVVETMAEGVVRLKDHVADKELRRLEERIHYFLDRFYLSRISIRLIIHQHLLLFGNKNSEGNSSFVGCFDPSCDVLAVAKDAYENARFLCEQYYSAAPECHFSSVKPFDKDDGDQVTMTYVPVHLYYILFELFKNSLRAVVELYPDKSEQELPPLELLVCKGREDVSIRLADQGGGVPRIEMEKLFNYLFSTANPPTETSTSENAPLAGYGYGLPLARLYAKYFNGDLVLNSIDGFGTDALIYLKVLPKEASEILPIYNKTSSLKYSDNVRVKDWSEPHCKDN